MLEKVQLLTTLLFWGIGFAGIIFETPLPLRRLGYLILVSIATIMGCIWITSASTRSAAGFPAPASSLIVDEQYELPTQEVPYYENKFYRTRLATQDGKTREFLLPEELSTGLYEAVDNGRQVQLVKLGPEGVKGRIRVFTPSK